MGTLLCALGVLSRRHQPHPNAARHAHNRRMMSEVEEQLYIARKLELFSANESAQRMRAASQPSGRTHNKCRKSPVPHLRGLPALRMPHPSRPHGAAIAHRRQSPLGEKARGASLPAARPQPPLPPAGRRSSARGRRGHRVCLLGVCSCRAWPPSRLAPSARRRLGCRVAPPRRPQAEQRFSQLGSAFHCFDNIASSPCFAPGAASAPTHTPRVRAGWGDWGALRTRVGLLTWRRRRPRNTRKILDPRSPPQWRLDRHFEFPRTLVEHDCPRRVSWR